MKICLSCEGVTNTAAQRCGHCGAFLLGTDSVHYPDRRGEADAGNPLLGTVVDGKYRLQGVLGRGGLGTVFQAVHVGSLMPVAVKLLHPRYSERAEYRRALIPEARRAATVTDTRCCRMLDVGEAEDGVAYLAMELVDGDTLDVLVRSGALAPSHALLVLMQVAEALVAIHAAGLVHCDLSPRNVMVSVRDGDLRVKVLDFGIARTATLAGAERARPGEFAAFVNPAFAAPEHLSGQDVDARADLYSFGMLGWLLLTGSLPIDDSDQARAVRAIVAGELQPWPNVPGVPRRLLRLIQSCLLRDPAARPPSAQAVLRELNLVYSLRRPALGGAAVLTLAAAAMAAIVASLDAQPPFLSSVGDFDLQDRLGPAASGVQHLRSEDLATLQFRFGGFPADRLRIEVSHGLTVLRRMQLHPEVDADGGRLTLAVAQAEWRSVVESLLSSSRKGPVDLAFVVPGSAPLGRARVRLDDEPPQVNWSITGGQAVLSGSTQIVWQAEDAELAGAEVHVAWRDDQHLELPLIGKSGEFALGAALGKQIATASDLGGCEVLVVATDRAGNESQRERRPFARSDLSAPKVIEVTGPASEPYVPCSGGLARLRVRTSANEPDCVLRLQGADGREYAKVPLDGPGTWHLIEVPCDGSDGSLTAGPVDFVVTDAAGNRTSQSFPLTLRNRSPRLEFAADGPGLRMVGDELVVDAGGARASLLCTDSYRVVRTAVTFAPGSPARGTAEPVRFEVAADAVARLVFGAMPPGSHRLEIELEETDAEGGHRLPQQLALRVLPAVIEMHVPSPTSRFLPGLLDAGVLARSATTQGLREGSRWSIDPELLPYLRGTLWVGSDNLLPLPLLIPERPADPLLPEVLPTAGHNVLAVELRDVLDRPVRVFVGDAESPRREVAGRVVDVVADFWWSEDPPEPIGEELLVEYGQPARLRLRMPLLYRTQELPDLRLGIAQSEVAAQQVTADGPAASIVTFELPFVAWTAAAQLTDRTREEYAASITSRFRVSVTTPVGRFDLELRLATTRSTLRPVGLLELGKAPAELAAVRLVPVLAPEAPFAEPVPANAPPRALFRPQPAVVVKNIGDFVLQDRELTCGEARALVAAAQPLLGAVQPQRLVHADDPLGAARLRGSALLPAYVASAAADQPLCGVDYFQAHTCCRLLGLVVAGDPDLFRLPLGCELELAAFGAAPARACNGPAAAAHPVSMAEFRAAAERLAGGVRATAADSWRAGDVVGGAFDAEIGGLDFGVREWVCDLPHVAGEEPLLGEWFGNHEVHLQKVAAFASGASKPPDVLGATLRTFGIVRGLALGELDGLLAESGQRLDPTGLAEVPASVPGVLRTEQLRRDGRDLLSSGPDPRLPRIGFRVAGTAALLARLRGQR